MKSRLSIGILLLICMPAWAEDKFDADSLVFNNVFCSRSGDRTSYSIVGTGAFRAPRAENLQNFIVLWLNRHPHAMTKAVEESKLGPKLGKKLGPKLGKMDYIWIDGGGDSLNVDLVRNGIVPGGMMADGVEYLKSIQGVAHLDPDDPDFPKRMIDDAAYQEFMKKIAAAEAAARADKIGLWSEKYREMMEEEGYL